MASIVEQVEASGEYDEIRENRVPDADETQADALAHAARYLAEDIDAEAIVAASESGYTALKAAKFRPGLPIIASTPNDRVRRQLALSWGVHPTSAPYTTGGADAIIQNSVQSALSSGIVDSGDTVVVVSGMMTELDGINTSNMLKVHVAADTILSGQTVVEGLVSGSLYRATDGDLSAAPEGSVVFLPETVSENLSGDAAGVRGIVAENKGMKGHVAVKARELDIPMIAGATLPADADDGIPVTLDAERGVLYHDAVNEPQ